MHLPPCARATLVARARLLPSLTLPVDGRGPENVRKSTVMRAVANAGLMEPGGRSAGIVIWAMAL
jgi:hypothetical protein